MKDGVRLTEAHERAAIREIAEDRCRTLLDEDLGVLGYWEWLEGLERGVAAHHAGLLPAFKEVVEELFQKKLVKVVFATETLALGINMPARTVVLEKLDKFNGEGRVPITAGEYTQLTGRAGRRGIDVEGHSVIVWQDGLDPQAIASLASRRSYPLNSSFRPTYNMAVNLIERFGRERTREVLESSFAQFQADRAVVDLARKVRQQEESLDGVREGDGRPRAAPTCGSTPRSAARSATSRSRDASSASMQTRRQREKRQQQHRGAPSPHARAPAPQCPRARADSRWAERWWRLQDSRRTVCGADRVAHRRRRQHLRSRHRRARGRGLSRRGRARAAPDRTRRGCSAGIYASGTCCSPRACAAGSGTARPGGRRRARHGVRLRAAARGGHARP